MSLNGYAFKLVGCLRSQTVNTCIFITTRNLPKKWVWNFSWLVININPDLFIPKPNINHIYSYYIAVGLPRNIIAYEQYIIQTTAFT